ncbi:hypothetical protein [Chroococcidiopsis sp. CCMEE 29]|uniref:hypothetical protein n=1 Tax=Chroococcidiopsis sp. CCMEE 29 TaxID=155894 RepID=UPI00201FDBCD|nr:hypothetical protein [Chroococcidiopsis sp. CCMEE 29]
MKRQWKNVFVKIALSLLIDVALNLLGLDDLADYSQFIFEQETFAHSQSATCVVLCQ